MKFIYVYSSNKFKIKKVDFRSLIEKSTYFNPEEAIKRISREDHTESMLSVNASNAYIIGKVRRLLDNSEFDTLFYVIQNLEESVLLSVNSMLDVLGTDELKHD